MGGWFLPMYAGLMIGMIFMAIMTLALGLNAKQVATQICQFLDGDLIDYDIEGQKFKYIRCGDKKLIEGLDAEKLIEVLN